MDALCSILLSNLVEGGKTSHFPICYATNVSYTKMKRNTKGKSQGGTLSQVIWMEYLPSSLYGILVSEPDADHWWSTIFQVNAALVCGNHYYRFEIKL
jgi:hypothetical protein